MQNSCQVTAMPKPREEMTTGTAINAPLCLCEQAQLKDGAY